MVRLSAELFYLKGDGPRGAVAVWDLGIFWAPDPQQGTFLFIRDGEKQNEVRIVTRGADGTVIGGFGRIRPAGPAVSIGCAIFAVDSG